MKIISHRLQFSESPKFMASLLSNLAGNLVEGMIIKNAKSVKLNTKILSSVLNTQTLKIL